MSTGKLTQIVYDESSGRPVLFDFKNGSLISEKIQTLQCGLYRDQANFIAAVASDKILYSGTISRKHGLYNNFFLKRNKKTGKCSLIAIDRTSISVVVKSKRKLEVEDKSWQTKSSDLKKYFGSKRTKMATEQNERLQVDVETVKTALEQAAKETHVADSDIVPSKPDEHNSSYRPPINRQANKIQDVYPLHALIPHDILKELGNSAKELLETEKDDLKLHDFVKKEFIILQQSKLSEKEDKAQLLLYIDSLMHLVKQTARTISNKKFIACSYSSKVNAYILDNFTSMSASGRTRPMSMRDKGICYILVLSMLASNNLLNLEFFTKDLKLGLKKLQDMSRVLAFTSKGSDKSIVTLNLPLPAPITASPGNKRKR